MGTYNCKYITLVKTPKASAFVVPLGGSEAEHLMGVSNKRAGGGCARVSFSRAGGDAGNIKCSFTKR